MDIEVWVGGDVSMYMYDAEDGVVKDVRMRELARSFSPNTGGASERAQGRKRQVRTLNERTP